jgi:hypothetical protein
MSEFRGSRVGDVKETMQQESRFRDMKNCDLIAAVESRLNLDH